MKILEHCVRVIGIESYSLFILDTHFLLFKPKTRWNSDFYQALIFLPRPISYFRNHMNHYDVIRGMLVLFGLYGKKTMIPNNHPIIIYYRLFFKFMGVCSNPLLVSYVKQNGLVIGGLSFRWTMLKGVLHPRPIFFYCLCIFPKITTHWWQVRYVSYR